MNELAPGQAQAFGTVMVIAASAFLILGTVVLLARAAKPTVDRLAAVDLQAVSHAITEGITATYARPRVIDVRGMNA